MYIKPTILVADDEPSILEVLAVELEESYDVLFARDGLDAICLYEHNMGRVEAIITDLDMPRLNGQLVTEWVHHIRPQLPVIIMSGGVQCADLEELLQSPVVSFLSKPFEPKELESLLDSLLAVRQNEAA